jgi:hypothetical protein
VTHILGVASEHVAEGADAGKMEASG